MCWYFSQILQKFEKEWSWESENKYYFEGSVLRIRIFFHHRIQIEILMYSPNKIQILTLSSTGSKSGDRYLDPYQAIFWFKGLTTNKKVFLKQMFSSKCICLFLIHYFVHVTEYWCNFASQYSYHPYMQNHRHFFQIFSKIKFLLMMFNMWSKRQTIFLERKKNILGSLTQLAFAIPESALPEKKSFRKKNREFAPVLQQLSFLES